MNKAYTKENITFITAPPPWLSACVIDRSSRQLKTVRQTSNYYRPTKRLLCYFETLQINQTNNCKAYEVIPIRANKIARPEAPLITGGNI